MQLSRKLPMLGFLQCGQAARQRLKFFRRSPQSALRLFALRDVLDQGDYVAWLIHRPPEEGHRVMHPSDFTVLAAIPLVDEESFTLAGDQFIDKHFGPWIVLFVRDIR